MKDGFWMLLCAACLLLSARSVQARELTALDIFAQLPITLFENTPEGLSEDEKLRLIEQGASEFWEVERFDADRLVLVSRPFGETRVGLRVFRGGDRLLAALGAPCAPLSSGRKTPPVDSCRPIRRMTRSFPIFWPQGSGLRRMFPRRSCSALKMTDWMYGRSSGGLRASSTCPWASPCVISGSRGRLKKRCPASPNSLCCGDFRTCQAWIDAIVYGFCGPSRNYGPSFTMSLTPFCPRRPHVCFCCSCDGYGRCRSGWRR